jgi:hypothetical protein
MRNAIGQWSTVGSIAALERPHNTNKFDFQFLTAGAYHRVAMSSQINEGQVRRDVGIPFAKRLPRVSGSLQSEAGAHTIHDREVNGRL